MTMDRVIDINTLNGVWTGDQLIAHYINAL